MKAKTNRAATAAISNAFSQKAISRYRRLQAEFDRTKPIYEEISYVSPDVVAAIDEYANSYLSDVADGKRTRDARIHRHAAKIANSLAFLTVDWKPYARETLETYRCKGDEIGEGIPFDIAIGMRYVRHNLPELHARLVKMDEVIGPVVDMDGSDFSYSALLMRTALSLAA